MDFNFLKEHLEGDLFTDDVYRLIHATDASAYREVPLAVCRPAGEEDICKVVKFAASHNIPVIPRGAGTSLAGQVVGNGLVLDVSRYMNRILELNTDEKWVRVQPGVILDELNVYLKPHGLFFGPETSTSNRCVIGGMVGNNSCGAHSLIYGSTREHTLAIRAVLSDGSIATFRGLPVDEFHLKCKGDSLESRIYRHIYETLSNKDVRSGIRDGYPVREIPRRNTGYAVDLLMDTNPFTEGGEDFNLARLLAGSEGTLAIATEITLNLVPLPPAEKALVCAHFATREDALRANLIALEFNPGAVEMMDDTILSLTHGNIEQKKNRFFVEGDPAAILIVEFTGESREEILDVASRMERKMRESGYGYHFPIVHGDDMQKVWNLRKAGLGVLSGMKGDSKPVSLIEDTAVNVRDLPGYIEEIRQLLDSYGKDVVYHAHVGSGELHLRPVLNLKDPADVDLFYRIGKDVALLVRKYRGSISGEHGDGRLRSAFIPIALGEKNYELLREIKKVWDPANILNPGKITDAPPMDRFLRYEPGLPHRDIATVFDFSPWGGILRFAEQCNGSGDCRKPSSMGGTMCPSYMATLDEYTTTRARANMMREVLTRMHHENPFNDRGLYEILDLCLSCKGCKSECPSNVDMAKLKAEFLQHWHDSNGVPLRSRMIAHITLVNRIGSVAPGLFNTFVRSAFAGTIIKKMAGFATQRSIPSLHRVTLRSWAGKNLPALNGDRPLHGKLLLFIDEFSQFNDVPVGIKTIRLLTRLGYRVEIIKHLPSGRTFISKGFLRKAKKIAERNLEIFDPPVSEGTPVVGIEPSAILTFRDEYPDLAGKGLFPAARRVADNSLMIDEFIAREADAGRITPEMFSSEKKMVLLHGHCQQKAIASTASTMKMLSLPRNFEVREIMSGCCGMAGSFGYEKEHYDISMKIGELVLFPSVRNSSLDTEIAAPGTSCRQHILDGTGRRAKHPVELLHDALL